MNRRDALSILAAVPLVAKTELLSKDDKAVLEIARALEDHEDPEARRSWERGSEISDVIRSLAKRGYLEERAYLHETQWYRTTEKGRAALAQT